MKTPRKAVLKGQNAGPNPRIDLKGQQTISRFFIKASPKTTTSPEPSNTNDENVNTENGQPSRTFRFSSFFTKKAAAAVKKEEVSSPRKDEQPRRTSLRERVVKTENEENDGKIETAVITPKQQPRSQSVQMMIDFPPMTIVWAKCPKYPLWPAIVCQAPDTKRCYDKESEQVHVQFFDDPHWNATHGWVDAASMSILKATDEVPPKTGKKWRDHLEKSLKVAKRNLKKDRLKRKSVLIDFEKIKAEEGEEDSDEEGNENLPYCDDDSDNEEDSDYEEKKSKSKSKKKTSGQKRKRSGSNAHEPVEKKVKKETPKIEMASVKEELSEYELMRLKNIEERQKMFEQLGIDESKANVAEAFGGQSQNKQVASKRGLASAALKPKKSLEPTEVRKSLRLQKIEADTSTELPAKEPTTYNMNMSVGAEDRPNLPYRDLELEEIIPQSMKRNANYKDEDDQVESGTNLKNLVEEKKKFLKSFVSMKIEGGKETSFGKDPTSVLSSLTITSERVAKVVPDRIFSLAVHPSSEKLLVAVGGKWGGLGLWDVLDTESENDGVHLFEPHVRPINCLTWDKFDTNRLISTSYDGTVRCLDIQTATSQLIYGDEDDESAYTTYHAQQDAHVFFVTMGQTGKVGAVDLRTRGDRKCAQVFQVFNRISAKTVDVHPVNSNLILCPNNKGWAAVFDIRNSKKHADGMEPVFKFTGHNKALSGAFFSNVSGHRVASMAYDNKINLYDTSDIGAKAGELKPMKSIAHNNQTGRWLTTFKPSWHPLRDDLFFTGSMQHPRQINAFDNTGKTLPSLMGDELASICSIVKCHPTMNAVIGGNASGRVHVFM